MSILEKLNNDEVVLLYELIQQKLEDIEESILEVEKNIAHSQVFGSEEVTVLVTNLKTTEEISESQEDFLRRIKGWKKDYETIIDKLKPIVDLIDNVDY